MSRHSGPFDDSPPSGTSGVLCGQSVSDQKMSPLTIASTETLRCSHTAQRLSPGKAVWWGLAFHYVVHTITVTIRLPYLPFYKVCGHVVQYDKTKTPKETLSSSCSSSSDCDSDNSADNSTDIVSPLCSPPPFRSPYQQHSLKKPPPPTPTSLKRRTLNVP